LGDVAQVLHAQKPEVVTLAVSAFIAFVLNIPFWKRMFAAVAPQTLSDWLFLGAAAIALLVLMNVVLTLIARRKLFRIVLALVLPIMASAAFFMFEYGILIDDNMIRNVFETNTSEARDLISPKMLIAIGLFGVLPAYAVWRTPWHARPFSTDLAAALKVIAISLPLVFILLFPFWGTFLSTFRAHAELKLSLVPLNITSALSKYLKRGTGLTTAAVAPFGEDAARRALAQPDGRKSLFVIVVGETARADHFSLNGYERPTTPELAKINGLINFPQAYSCGTDTAQSVPCMFSGLGRDAFSNSSAAAQENLLDILKRAGLDVIWRENQAGCKGVCQRTKTETLTGKPHPQFNITGETHDEILLDGLSDRIAKLDRDTVIVLHMMGSHGPAYWKRYPAAFEAFTPVCKQSVFSRCTTQEIINAYDNTILYSDHVVAKLAGMLNAASQHNVDAAMWYMSDHGESLGEKNLYLHGMPYAIAPDAQIHVPMVMWMSQGFRDSRAIDAACLASAAQQKSSHDALFHSVLGIMDVSTKVYDKAQDFFAPCRQGAAAAR
jgi:lipid A ethanolaminephosphotransferase